MPRRIAWLIGVPVLLIAAAVFATASVERGSAIHTGRLQQASQRMLTAMLDQETGVRGYLLTGDSVFLEPWYKGSAEVRPALRELSALVGADSALKHQLYEQAAISSAWHAASQEAIDNFNATRKPPALTDALRRKATMDRFRAANASLSAELRHRGANELALATGLTVAVAAVLAIALAAAALLLLRRVTRIETERLKSQSELRELLQASETEDESRTLLIRHIEKIIPGAGAAVLNRNNSDDRLEPLLSNNAERTPLCDINDEQLRPRSCMAVRLSHSYDRQPGDETLMQCEVCGKIKGNIACEPLLVGGRVIGAVLVAQQKTIDAGQLDRLRESVIQAAPILANQRNLALAEVRAASDALTGLPNRRAAEETLRRMAAQAGRAVSPLAAVLVDLDHFKQVNDLHGHDQGDAALAVVAQILSSNLRTSDFAARYGGEEFLLLLPDTDRKGACELAEKIRAAIEHAEIARLGSLSASFGVAVLPDDAVETEQLVRKADRALYLAKENGRNRVETAAQSAVAFEVG